MNPRVLVVDDDDGIRFLYQKELSQAGYPVEGAASGSEAIEKFSRGSFGLVVLDIEIPDMSGLEILGRLREIAPETPIILNTAYSTYKLDFQSWLADAYLVKSSDMEPLKRKIRELTESP
ncbi:MAG: response regulator [candidate division Zixibacteria bacterium]|nr:response regulator [candidate division Zixibacteria bacterium]